MAITRIFTGKQFQKFDVGGVWNNKLIGKYDIDSTNVDNGRPATLDLSKGPDQTPVVASISPFVRNASPLAQPYKDAVVYVAMKQVGNWPYPVAKSGVTFDMTTNPRTLVLEDPVGPESFGYVGVNHINETGIYGSMLVTNPDRTSSSVRLKWDLNGKFLEKGFDYSCILPNGEKLDLAWCNENVPLPAGYVMGGGAYLPNSKWVTGMFYTANTDGSRSTVFNGFVVDPTGTVPDAKLFLPCADWSMSRVLDVSPDGRFVALRCKSIDPNYKSTTDYTWMVDTATDTHYDLKKLLGLDPWLAYQVVDVDFLQDGTNRFVTTSVSFEGIGTTNFKQVWPIDLWDALA